MILRSMGFLKGGRNHGGGSSQRDHAGTGEKRMIRDITIGQYYPAKSVLHRLDPRVKLVSTLLYLISLFLFKSIPGYIVATVFPGSRHTAVKGTIFLHCQRP